MIFLIILGLFAVVIITSYITWCITNSGDDGEIANNVILIDATTKLKETTNKLQYALDGEEFAEETCIRFK